MPIDLSTALAAQAQISEISWTTTDVLLYHLSLGAGSQADDTELNLTFERNLSVLPTFGLVAGNGPSTSGRPPGSTADDTTSSSRMKLPGIDVDLRAVLHAGQSITVHRSLPSRGSAECHRKVSQIHDLGTAALIVLETTATDDEGPLWTEHSRIYVRGEGGFGGESGPERQTVPDREPDTQARITTHADQALLYRLNGDFNPLHVDPEFARTAGLPGPILHGLATFGIVTKALMDTVADGRPDDVHEVSARFTGTVVPGDVLLLDIWETKPGTWAFRTRVEGSQRAALDEGVFILR